MRLSKKKKDENMETKENLTEEPIQENTPSEEKMPEEESSKEYQELMNRLIRMQADFDNYKKRTTKEKEDIFKYALEDFSLKMLPVLDNLERAIQALDDSHVKDEYANGVRMVLKQLLDVLEKEGLTEILCNGESFDPNLHHGVTVEDSDDHEDDEIIDVFQKGYKFKEKVIRPAMVKICKKINKD
ncbi:nucleotide exchange factor GrpE [Alkalibacter rhizosphaerae]|uniref:Protein GrpE n=1 Tax=Alkalibacter rhizosphaerae TaxID=2815577 RepID=A0A974XFF6_9FIRM|nr:nucleotide exchange factor GrpE [Alkalibacter rhizosphaerae]